MNMYVCVLESIVFITNIINIVFNKKQLNICKLVFLNVVNFHIAIAVGRHTKIGDTNRNQ